MRNLMRILSKLFNQTVKSSQLQRHIRAVVSKYHRQPERVWRLVGNQTIKNKISGNVVYEKARFFVPKAAAYSPENVGKSLEKFRRYVESKGFRISFDLVKLALVGVALNNGDNHLALDALHHSFTQDVAKDKDWERKVIGSHCELGDFLFTRRLENGFEEVYTKEKSDGSRVDDQKKEEDVEDDAYVGETDHELEENGMLITFEKGNLHEDKSDAETTNTDGGSGELSERLMQLLLLYLHESNNNLKEIQHSQRHFEVLLSGEREMSEGGEDSEVVDANGAVVEEGKTVKTGCGGVEDENERLKKVLNEKENEIAELRRQVEMLKQINNNNKCGDNNQSGNDASTCLVGGDGVDDGEDDCVLGEQTYRGSRCF